MLGGMRVTSIAPPPSQEYKLGSCHKGAVYACADSAAGTAVANVSSYNDDACVSFNSSKLFDSGKCTPTGPKTARTSKLVVCF